MTIPTDPTPEEESSRRQILRSSSIIGGASIINLLLGLLRQKASALILGAEGVGLIGLFQTLLATASAIASLGLGNVGTRQIAEAVASQDEQAIAGTRRALFWGTVALSLLGSLILWTLRGVIADKIFGDPSLAGSIGWLSLGVALTVGGTAQVALLTGLRKIGDVARVSVISSALSAAAGVAALAAFGENGLLLFVLSTPLMAFLTAHYFTAKLPRIRQPRSSLPQLIGQWRVMAALGAALVISGIIGNGGQLIIRTFVQRELGLAALGYLQASLTLSITYLGFILSAMSTDYYPRLTGAFSDPDAANRLVNEQSEVALLLAAPVLLAVLGFAPWLLHILYSAEFKEASGTFRWLLLADVAKIASWPLGFLILASGDARTYMLTELISTAIMVGVTLMAVPVFGLEGAGFAVLTAYVSYLPLVYWIGKRKTRFGWSSAVRRIVLALAAASLAVFMVAAWNELWGLAAGLVLGAGFAAWGFSRLKQAVGDRLLGKLGLRRRSRS